MSIQEIIDHYNAEGYCVVSVWENQKLDSGGIAPVQIWNDAEWLCVGSHCLTGGLDELRRNGVLGNRFVQYFSYSKVKTHPQKSTCASESEAVAKPAREGRMKTRAMRGMKTRKPTKAECRKGDGVKTSLYMPAQMKRKICELAEREGVSLSAMAQRLLEEVL